MIPICAGNVLRGRTVLISGVEHMALGMSQFLTPSGAKVVLNKKEVVFLK